MTFNIRMGEEITTKQIREVYFFLDGKQNYSNALTIIIQLEGAIQKNNHVDQWIAPRDNFWEYLHQSNKGPILIKKKIINVYQLLVEAHQYCIENEFS